MAFTCDLDIDSKVGEREKADRWNVNDHNKKYEKWGEECMNAYLF